MESKSKRGPRQPENYLPNTIVIQLVSAQPQTMPTSVRAMPLLPGSKSTVEQPRRPAPPAPNRPKSPTISPCPPRLQSTINPLLRRRAPTDEFRYSNQPLGQERTMWTEYVYHPEEVMTPIYNPPLADLKETGGICCCHNCRFVRRSIPEPDDFMGNQTSPRLSDIPKSRQESANTKGRCDQSTITDDQPQHLELLKTICETLGQAIVAAAMATVQTANKNYSSTDSSPIRTPTTAPTRPNSYQTVGAEVNAHSFLKAEFLNEVEVLSDTQSTPTKEHLRPSTEESIVYPKTPIESPSRVLKLADPKNDRMPSGSSPGVHTRSNHIIQHRPYYMAGGLPVRIFPKVNQTSAGIKVKQGPAIRRRFPTEDLKPLKQKNKSGPTSPTALMPVIKQSEENDLLPDLTVVTLPPDPDLGSYSQTDDPCLPNKI